MAFVVSSGQVQSVQQSPYPYSSFGPTQRYLSLTPSLAMTYEEIWRTQPAVRTVCAFLARNVAQLPLDVFRRVSDADRVKLGNHPLARMLEHPVAGTKWTKYRLLNTLMHDLLVYDNAFLVKMRQPGGLRGLLPVPRRLIAPVGTNWLYPESYRLQGNVGFQSLSPDEVVHIHGYNPVDPREGVAPIETLRQILAEEYEAATYREQMWRNGARVSGYIQRPKDAPRWSPDARDRFASDWRAQYTGDGAGTGGVPLLEDGMSFAASGVTPREAQYVEARKLTREEVAVAYHVSPVMLGLMDGATFSNVTELHKMLYQDTLPPWLTQISQDIETQLLPDLDQIGAATGAVYVEFNLSQKLQGSFETQAAALQSAVGGPWMTRAEARAMNNLPAVDGADELITPLNVTAGGLASPNDTAPDHPNNDASNGMPPSLSATLRRFLARQGASVVCKAGAAGGTATVADVFDTDRWTAELAGDLAAALGVDTRAAIAAALRTADPVAALRAEYAGRVQAIDNHGESVS